ncbi:hypothetical protein KAR91_63055 [Candidatus Pacearchaeota archaeon]|nr:hypothetical protein [Candidatus Pacearchaeota archaeon]
MRKLLGYSILIALASLILYGFALVTGWEYTLWYFGGITVFMIFVSLTFLGFKLIGDE